MRCFVRFLLLLLLLGPVTSAEAADDPVPPGHREAMAACNIQNKELCGWWERDAYLSILIRGTQWQLGDNVHTCEVLLEERRENGVYSAFLCKRVDQSQGELNILSMIRGRTEGFDSLRLIYPSSGMCTVDQALKALLLDPLRERPFDLGEVISCGRNVEIYSRRSSLTNFPKR
ncbi:MAG: hypothetical protein RLY86_3165 [Pseudomonadota bacterium]|jgi:hypothetical protein